MYIYKQGKGVNPMGNNKWISYEQEKQRFLKDHPEATPEEIEEFLKDLAKKLNI